MRYQAALRSDRAGGVVYQPAVASAMHPSAMPPPTPSRLWRFRAERPTFRRMIAFATLLERLVFTPSRNAKIALLRRYFATQPDPERGIGLAAITGELSFTTAKPGLIRELAATRTDPVLFDWSYDYVGDLAETVALIWQAATTGGDPPTLARGGRDAGNRAQSGAAGPSRGMARLHRCLHAPGPAEADHRRPARRRLGPSGEDRTGRNRRRQCRRRRGGLARPCATLCAVIRLARGQGPEARSCRCAGFPPAHAGASVGGSGSRRPPARRRGAPSGNGTASASSWSPLRAASASIPAAQTTSPAPFPKSSARWTSTPCWTASFW